MKKTTTGFESMIVSCMFLFGATASWAVDGVWNGTQSAYWTNSANWSAAPYPSGAQTATFTNDGLGQTTINLQGLSTIKNITFDTVSVAAYTNGAGAVNSQTNILLDSGVITLTATAANSQLFNCGLQLGTNIAAGAYILTNANTTQTLTFNKIFGAASGGTAAAKALVINGAGNTTILGNVLKGGASTISLTNTSSGTCTLMGTNTFATVNMNGTGKLVLSGSNIVTTLNMNGSAATIVDIGAGFLDLSSGSGNALNCSQGGFINGTGKIRLSTGDGIGSTGYNYADLNVAAGKTLTINPEITGLGGIETWSGTGTFILNGTNTFAAHIIFGTAATISVGKIGNSASVDSNLGKGTNINFSANGGKLIYTGSGEDSNRMLLLNHNATIDQSGTGTLRFVSPVTANATTKTLTLQGSTTGVGEIAGVITAGSGTATSLTKAGTGTWILSGINTYAGATTVNGGTLLVNAPGSLYSASAVTVNNNSAVGGNGTINGPVTVAVGGMLAPGGVNTLGTLSLGNNSVQSLTLNSSMMFFDLPASGTACDKIALTGPSGTLVLNGANVIALSFPNGAAQIGTYTLMTYAAKTGAGSLKLLSSYPNAVLTVGATSVTLDVTAPTGGASLTWNGNVSGVWDGVPNWTNGTAAATFTDGDAVTFDDTASGTTTVTNTAPISPASVLLNNSTKTYTLSAMIGGLAGLFKAGTGTATLSGASTFSGDSTLAKGTLNAGVAQDGTTSGPLGANGNINFTGGTLQFSSASASWDPSARIASGVSSAPISIDTAGQTITFGTGMTASQPVGLTKTGTGTLILTGDNTLATGPTTISAGVLQIGNNGTSGTLFGTGTVTVATEAGLQFKRTDTPSSPLIVNNTINKTGGTYSMVVTNGAVQIGGLIDNNSNAADVKNGGTLILAKASTPTVHALGNASRVDTGGTMKLGGSGNYQIYFGVNVTVNSGGVLDLNSCNQDFTGGGGRIYLSGTGISNSGALINSTTAALSTLMFGTGGLTLSSNASIGGPGNMNIRGVIDGTTFGITKVGSGSLTLLSANTYSGATTNKNGRLVGVTGGSCANSAIVVQSSGSGAAATLGVAITNNTKQWTCASLTTEAGVDSGTGPNLQFTYFTTPSTNVAPLNVTGNVTFNALPTLTVDPANLAPGTYPLLVAGGSVPGTAPTTVTIGRGLSGSVAWGDGVSYSTKTLVLTVTGTAALPLTWNSATSGTWDVNNAANAVWKDAQSVSTNYQESGVGDQVLFDDTVAADTVVTLNSPVKPVSMIVSNETWNYTLSGTGAIEGFTGLTKAGSGTLTLATTNTYMGQTIIAAGTLSVGADGNLGFLPASVAPASLLLAGGTLLANDTFTLATTRGITLTTNSAMGAASGKTLTYGGIITGGFSLTNSGAGTLILSGANTYTGGTTIKSNATLSILSTAARGTYDINAGGLLSFDAGSAFNAAATTFTGAGTLRFARTIIFNAAGNTTVALGAGGLVWVTGNVTVTGSSSYHGIWDTNLGSLLVDAGSTIDFVEAGSTAKAKFDALNGNGTVKGGYSAGTLMTLGANNGSGTFYGVLANSVAALSLTKIGTGTQTLTGANTYTGTTTINDGKLVGVTGGHCNSSAVRVQSSGSLAKATLSVSITDSTKQWTCASLTTTNGVSGGDVPTLDFVFRNPPSTTLAPLNVTGNVMFNEIPAITVDPANLVAGTYPLLVAGGTVPATTPTSVTIGRGLTGSVAWGTGTPYSTKTLVLTVTGTSDLPLTWNTTGSGTWDINNAGNTVWKNAQNASTNYQESVVGNPVVFNDTVTAETTVTLNETVKPANVIVDNSDNNYIMTGNGSIAGATRLNKSGSGTLTLQTTNTYSGVTAVAGGSLVLSGPNGAITGSSALTLASGSTLQLSNTADNNSTNRLGNAIPVALTNATLEFAHTAGAADYSETLGTVTLAGTNNTVAVSKADSGRTSTLTLGALTRTIGSTVNFSGADIGADNNNRIKINGYPEGFMGFWATVNATNYPIYSSVLGVTIPASTAIAARGPASVIPDDASVSAQINTDGESGSVTLAGATVNQILSVAQNTSMTSTVNTASKTLKTSGIQISAGKAALTIGEAEGDGFITPLNPGGTLLLNNDSLDATLTINAQGINNVSASGVTKGGAGKVVLAGPQSYTGVTTINEGALTFGGSSVQTLGNVITGPGALVKEGSGTLNLNVGNNFAGGLTVNAGTLNLNAANTYTGGTRVNAGTVNVNNINALSTGAVTNNGTLNIIGGVNVTISGLATSLSGAGINNVTLSTDKTGSTYLNGDYSGFTGVWNIGIGGLADNASRATMNGLDNSAATINVLSNATLWVLQAGVHNAALVLNGGDQGEPYGQLRIDIGEWAGPITLAGHITAATDGFIGSQNQDGIISGIIGEVNGPYALSKVGTKKTTLTGTNTFRGPVWVKNGSISVPSINEVGTGTGPLGSPLTDAQATIKLGQAGNPGTLIYTGTNVVTARIIEMAGTTGGAGIDQSGTNALVLTGGMTISGTGNKTLTLQGSTTGTGEFTGPITNGNGSVISVVKSGTGTWTLPATNTFSGGLTVNNGKLFLAGSNGLTTATVNIGAAAGDSVVKMTPGSSLIGTTGNMTVGSVANGYGAFYLDGGRVVRTPAAADGNFTFGTATGGYGYFNMSDGYLANTRLQLGYNGVVGMGLARITGGIATFSEFITIARTGGGTGVLTIDGGSVYHTNASQNVSLGYDGGRAELNMTGGLLDSTGKPLTVRQSANSPTGIVNLCSGTLIVDYFQNTSPGVALLNFNGGLLKAGAASTAFLPANMTGVYVNGPFGANAGGARIDSAGKDITFAAPLRAPTGNGVTSISLSTEGSGYIGEPYVSITGDGVGATAVANMVDDGTGNGTYKVASVTVTTPGVNYTTAAVSFLKGGATAVAPTASANLSTTVPAGLTKLGTGVLTLGGVNTYGGETTISNGTLKLGVANALPTNSIVNVGANTYDLGGFVVTNGQVNVTSGSIINGSLVNGSLTVNDSAVISAALSGNTGLTKNGPGTLVLKGYAGNFTPGPLVVNGGTLTLSLLSAPLTNALSYWLDASDSSKITLAGSNVTYWADSSPAGVNFTNTVAVQWPVYVTNAINGRSAVSFSGMTNRLVASKAANAQTVFIVNTVRGSRSGNDGIWGQSGQDNGIRLANTTTWIQPTANVNDFSFGGQMFVNSIFTNIFTASTPHVLTAVTTNRWVGRTTAIGDYWAATGQWRSYNGYIGEVLVYDSVLSTNDRQRVEGYLLNKWFGVASASLPSVELASGTILDLDGQSLSLTNLLGSGTVSNGTLTVTGSISPAGTNVIGTLTVKGNTTLSGKLLANVSTDGTSDCLDVQGNLTLLSPTLEIADLAGLSTLKMYTLVTCSGTLTGTFTPTNLPDRWALRYTTDGKVQLYFKGGTMVRIM